MPDLKLFHLSPTGVAELPGSGAQVEKSLQILFEKNLEALLGVRFLATEFVTGKAHGGRIDTLGLDENGSPVIIEYKRSTNDNVINQGLFYLDWLMDHRKDFQWLVMEKLGPDVAKAVDWSGPRLICIAGDFSKFDGHAVKQINRNIELIRYRHYGDDLLLLEQVHTTQAGWSAAAPGPAGGDSAAGGGPPPDAPGNGEGAGSDAAPVKGILYRISKLAPAARDLFEAVKAHLHALGDDVQEKGLLHYIAFRRIKNFACVEVFPKGGSVVLYLKVDPTTVDIAAHPDFLRDMRGIGHYGTGDLEVVLKSMADLDRAAPLIQRAYDGR